MKSKKLSPEFLKKCKSVKSKRPRTVINHILKHGQITTEELRDIYGYNHPPRAARDVREQGIPLETFRVEGKDGRKIAAYRFGEFSKTRKLVGRTAFSKNLKEKLIERYGAKCAIYLEPFPESELQIDHRVPYEVAGDSVSKEDVTAYMLLSPSANRAKSWSCEHCLNGKKLRNKKICLSCYWAFPENYEHVTMRQVRRLDLLWQGDEVKNYERLKHLADDLSMDLPGFVKDVLDKL